MKYKVVTVTNDDTTINAEIENQYEAGWTGVFSLTVSGENIIILFYKIIA